MAVLKDRKVAFLVANEGVEQVELTDPWDAVEAEAGEPVLIAPRPGEVQAFDHLDKADVFDATVTTSAASVDDYVGLVLPGGVANPDALRTDDDAIDLIRAFFEAGKPVGVICHGPWTLIEADVVRGRTLTSWPSVRTDIRNAGGTWVDEQVVVCEEGPNRLVSSRNPDDLPAFSAEVVETLSQQA